MQNDQQGTNLSSSLSSRNRITYPYPQCFIRFSESIYGRRSWEYELKAAQDFDFDPIIHLSCFDGTPLHNNIRFSMVTIPMKVVRTMKTWLQVSRLISTSDGRLRRPLSGDG